MRSIVVAIDERPRGVVNHHDVGVFRDRGERVRDRILPPGAALDHRHAPVGPTSDTAAAARPGRPGSATITIPIASQASSALDAAIEDRASAELDELFRNRQAEARALAAGSDDRHDAHVAILRNARENYMTAREASRRR